MFTQQQQGEIITRRHEIAIAYCKKMGWPTILFELSFAQVLEIRKQQNWIDVPNLVAAKSLN